MSERFTGTARKVVVLAQEEARRLRHCCVGTEHLLLGLLQEDEATRVFTSLNVTLDEVREQVQSIVGYGDEETGGKAPFTPRSMRVLELALREAMRLGQNYVGAEHILLGLVSESEGVAALALGNLGVAPDRVRREVLVVLGEAPDPGNWVLFRAKVEALEVHVHCGVSDEERAMPQTLLVDLEYAYETPGTDDVSGVVDYGVLLEEVARVLEHEEFRLLETGARRAGEHVLERFPAVREVTVTVTKPRAPVDRVVSGVSVEATFRR